MCIGLEKFMDNPNNLPSPTTIKSLSIYSGKECTVCSSGDIMEVVEEAIAYPKGFEVHEGLYCRESPPEPR
jgi:hypothetical protein